MNARAHQNRIPKFLPALALCLVSAWTLLIGVHPAFAQTNTDTDKQTQITELKKQRDDAIKQVQKIVNQPLPRYARQPGMSVIVETYHPGAPTPDFDNVDVRKTQEPGDPAHGPYVTCAPASGVVFRTADTEFNEMTKYFITDRSVPKKKLTEAEMLEINRLYRIIGDCRKKIFHLENPPPKLDDIRAADAGSDSGTNSEPATELVREPVPRENYVKAAIGVSAILLVYVLFLLVRRLIRS